MFNTSRSIAKLMKKKYRDIRIIVKNNNLIKNAFK